VNVTHENILAVLILKEMTIVSQSNRIAELENELANTKALVEALKAKYDPPKEPSDGGTPPDNPHG
jgi:hypothetical protein